MAGDRIVVVGGGVAGGRLVAALREQGHAGSIDLVCAESCLPYDRPPLSKEALLESDFTDKWINPEDFYPSEQITLHLGQPVLAIDRIRKLVTLPGKRLAYDRLVLATGSAPRELAIPGAELPAVTAFRNRRDSVQVARALTGKGHIVVIGGGFIGLEVAASARQRGCDVTVIEAGSQLMTRSAPFTLAYHVAGLHRRHGIKFNFEGFATNIDEEPHGLRVTLNDGRTISASLVVYGIGVSPNTSLAAEAGLDVDDGILVDEAGRTSDPAIFAIGDCARGPDVYAAAPCRHESWESARLQAQRVACALVGRAPPPPEPAWLWSQQFDVLLQFAGSMTGERQVVRGDVLGGDFIIFSLHGGAVVGAAAFERRAEMAWARRLIAQRWKVDSRLLANANIPLKAVRVLERQSRVSA